MEKYNNSQLQTVKEELHSSSQYDQIEPQFQNLKNMLQFSDTKRQAAEQFVNEKDLSKGKYDPTVQYIRIPRAHLLKP
jgi:hypothetical protein